MNVVSDNLLCRISSFLVLFFSFVFSASLMATDGSLPVAGSLENQKIWKSVGTKTEIKRIFEGKSTTLPITARLFELDEIGFKSLLRENKNESDNSVAARAHNNVSNASNTILLPLPDGSEVNVKIIPSAVMSEGLAQQYPDIKTWKVTGVSEDITGVIDFTHQGFHGMLLMPDGDRVFIEPDAGYSASNQFELAAQGSYISFSKRLNKDSFISEFSCGVHDDSKLPFNAAA